MNINKRLIKRILTIGSAVLLLFSVIFVAVVLIRGFSGQLEPGKETAKLTEDPSHVSTPPAGPSPTGVPSETVPTEDPGTPAPVTYREITLLASGDITLYKSMWESAKAYGGGEYDFSELTKYVKDIISSHDYAVANFEGTVTESDYSDYPMFRVPDNIIKTAAGAGFDMMLFANNHTYDGGHTGLLRTQQKFAENGLACIGTKTEESAKSYGVFDVSGIKIGMLNYTYESPPDYEKDNRTQKFLNGIRLDTRDVPLVDSFYEGYLSGFYAEIKERIQEMKQDGAQFIVVFMHWGSEYENSGNTLQKTIAQNLCEEGVDLLIGSHPHVIQQVETFTSSDQTKKMLCYYSLGNFISVQNRLTFSPQFYDTGFYAENGLLASVTIRQYSTGETVISKADYVATWMHRHSVNGRLVFNVVPLEKALANEEANARYGLTESSFGLEHARAAYEYLTKLIQPGVSEFNDNIHLPQKDAVPAEK